MTQVCWLKLLFCERVNVLLHHPSNFSLSESILIHAGIHIHSCATGSHKSIHCMQVYLKGMNRCIWKFDWTTELTLKYCNQLNAYASMCVCLYCVCMCVYISVCLCRCMCVHVHMCVIIITIHLQVQGIASSLPSDDLKYPGSHGHTAIPTSGVLLTIWPWWTLSMLLSAFLKLKNLQADK